MRLLALGDRNPDFLTHREIDSTIAHYCGCGLDEHFASKLQDAGVVISAHPADASLEALELAEYPFFLATAFQPQVGSSQSGALHPVLSAWLRAAAAGPPVRPGR